MRVLVYTCDRCHESCAGDFYRVMSESGGETLLDMIVCYGCYIEASELGLDTETIEVSQAAALH